MLHIVCLLSLVRPDVNPSGDVPGLAVLVGGIVLCEVRAIGRGLSQVIVGRI